jgi:hypothetical protein
VVGIATTCSILARHTIRGPPMIDLSQEDFSLADAISHRVAKCVRRFFIEEHEVRSG